MYTRLSHTRGSRVFYAEQEVGERWLQLFRAHKMPTVPVSVWQSTNALKNEQYCCDTKKPLLERLFLLCKKVQVFVEAYGDAPIRGAFCAIWENVSGLLV